MALTYVRKVSEEDRRRLRALSARASRYGCSIQRATENDPTAADDELGTYRVWDDEAHITAACADGKNYGLTLEQVSSWLDEEGRNEDG